MKNRNKLILLACLFLGITSCLSKQVYPLPTQQMIILEPTPLIAPEINLTATKYPNSKMCAIENHQGDFLTSFRREFGESPDKTWLFVQCLYNDENHSHYVLLNQSNPSKSWAIEFPEIIENPLTWYAWGWTKDSQTLYLGYRPFCEYAITCMHVDAKAVYLLSSTTHQFSSILPFRDDKTQYSFDFSRDTRFLAYIITGTQTLYVRDLTIDAENEIELDRSESSYGNLHWSPEDNYLVFHSSSKEDISLLL